MPSGDEHQMVVAAPDLPSGPRSALVIATSSYADSQLRQLRSPVKDAEDFAAVLGNPQIGGFGVAHLIDEPESRIRRGIAAFLHGRSTEETVLIYLSCHGIQDRRGNLFFAATDTDTQLPYGTAIRAADVLVQLDDCRAQQQILILDCCFSGSFNESKGSQRGEQDLERQLRGHSRGREVLTASRAFEYSFEGEPLGAEVTGSVFTTGLVEGVRTGSADTDRDGHITVEEAYRYAFGYTLRQGTPQTPQRWLSHGEGSRIILARSPAGRVVAPARLPEDLKTNLESRYPDVRIGAVMSTAAWLTDPDPARRFAATLALEEIVRTDIPRVAEVANAHLERTGPVKVIHDRDPNEDEPRIPWIPETVTDLLRGNAAAVYSVVFSRGGVMVASAGHDGTARLWDAATGRQVRVLAGHRGWVRAVAFNLDGSQLASGGGDWTVRLWDTATGKVTQVLTDHNDVVRGAAFSPDGAWLASCGEGGTLRLWDIASGWRSRTLRGHSHAVRGVAFSPDGALLASCGSDKTVRLWDATSGWRSRVLRGHSGWVRRVTFSPDGTTIASCGEDGTVRLWKTSTGEPASVLEGHSSVVFGVAFSCDGALLASCGGDGAVRLWDAATGAEIRVLEGHAGVVYDVAFSPDGSLLASAGEDRTIRFWR
jgi:hypothetical protein